MSENVEKIGEAGTVHQHFFSTCTCNGAKSKTEEGLRLCYGLYTSYRQNYCSSQESPTREYRAVAILYIVNSLPLLR